MKNFLVICAVAATALLVFTFLPKNAEADKHAFGKNDIEKIKQISLEYLKTDVGNRHISGSDELKIQSVEIDDFDMAHTKVRQTVDDIPVWEGEAIVHLKSDRSLSGITDELKPSVVVNTQANFSPEEALSFAKRIYRGSRFLTEAPKVDLWIFRAEDRDHLAYRVQMRREDGTSKTAMPVFFIDAQTGEKIFEYDNLQTATGTSLYSGTVNITTSVSGTTYYMEDTTRRMGTFNMNNTGNTNTGTGGTQSRYMDTNDVWDTTAQKAGVDAHLGAASTYDYYKNIHGRNGIDGNNGPGSTAAAANSAITLLPSRVHFGSNYNNAFWNGSAMTYGDGNGTTFSPLVTLDIAGHEMTHGLTERTANLTYAKESGALNEAMSDIFGSMVERYAHPTTWNWRIGEDAYTPGTAGDSLRRMDNPNADGDPDHYSLRLYQGACTPSSSTNDNCGVHTNSSIANHNFYLAAAGGTNRVSGVSVTGMGPSDAEKIWFRALTVYMTSGTTFAGARTATLNAATDLFGSTSTQYNTVATAWCAVGVGACPSSATPTPTPTATPTATPTPNPTPTGGELLVNGGFEGSVSPWISSGNGALYSNGAYPRSGTGYVLFGTANNVTGQSYQQVSIPATATGTLTFWLNVTSTETTTTTQYDKLFVEVRNTAGTLLTTLGTYSNLNKAATGAYSQKSLNVSAYKGQTVRVQFRTTTDSSEITTFRVDDASVK